MTQRQDEPEQDSDVSTPEVEGSPEPAETRASGQDFFDAFLSFAPGYAALEEWPAGEESPGVLMKFEEALTLEGQVEALLFASPKPLKAGAIVSLLSREDETGPGREEVEAVLQSLEKSYGERQGGFRLENLKSQGYQFRTVPAAAPLMEVLFASRPRPLSKAALETLAIVAYRQPVTRAEIEFIRGVDAGSILKNLMERELILCVGRKEDAGRPMLFGTGDEFLRVFGLEEIGDIPPLSAFQPAQEVVEGAGQKLVEGEEEGDQEIGDLVNDPDRGQLLVSRGLEIAGRAREGLENPLEGGGSDELTVEDQVEQDLSRLEEHSYEPPPPESGDDPADLPGVVVDLPEELGRTVSGATVATGGEAGFDEDEPPQPGQQEEAPDWLPPDTSDEVERD